MKALIILIMFIVAVYLIGVNFVIWHEHQHVDGLVACGIDSNIVYSSFGWYGVTISEPVFDEEKKACAIKSAIAIDGWTDGFK